MKLTEEHVKCDCNEMLAKTNVSMPEKCHIIHEDTLDWYDYYQEKAEKCIHQNHEQLIKEYNARWPYVVRVNELQELAEKQEQRIYKKNDQINELKQENKKLKEELNDWHVLDCKQVTDDNPTCRCMQLNHHVGAFKVALFIGLTKKGRDVR